ncbi:MAG: diguanylate cyclase [Pseudomonadota bacterium]|nr:diguanylate cyclase [Pseudomonadota bacterium]MDP1904459.1 diguanylate cyclase [Pseudomonadota bacterium]MDP2351391.1 diguanylate cyclase [Pseudomonadota bacterium]
MERPNQPADIARAAIRLLGTRRLQPTPDNFRQAYSEVSGEKADKPRETGSEKAEAKPELRWADAIRPLIKQWDAHQIGLGQTKKREMLERVLINFGHDGQQLHDKLSALARSWATGGNAAQEERVAGEVEVTAVPAAAVTAVATARDVAPTVVAPDTWPSLRQSLAGNLRLLADSCEPRWPDLAARAAALATAMVASASASADSRHFEELAAIWRELLIRAEDDHELSTGLRRLVGLLFLNLGELVGDESWFSGQMAAMQAMIDGNLNPEAVRGAERGLRELVFKQGMIKGNLDDAKEKLRSLITTFIDRIGAMSDDADGYHARIGAYSEQIGQARDIGELGEVIEGLTNDMDGMRQALRGSHGELQEARAQAEQAEQRIQALEGELAQVSNLVREDQLTGTLNRRGLEEAFTRELARADRLLAPLSISLLDIDHFKKLNDSLGHQAGDEALKHLTRVVRDLLRPTDSLARYGGEEFLILLPNTGLDEAERILKRLQRELTRQFFLHDNDKVLITFSAGIAERDQDEAQAALIARVDAAMYRAKAAGRNRVERG